MKYRMRSGEIVCGNDGQDQLLRLLYGSMVGRFLIRGLVHPAVSKIGGEILNSSLSRFFIRPFVWKHQIDLTQYQKQCFASYNDFFKREVKGIYRPIEEDPDCLISPCDAKLSVYPVSEKGKFWIKQTPYTVTSLLRNKKLSNRFLGGTALIFRLTVDDYHHYCYPETGEKSRNHRIPGVLHTVNPVANDVYPIYKENAREYCLIHTKRFKTMLMMEVGALMVGKICNRHQGLRSVRRGQEKGHFEFGGSTIVLLLQKDAAILDPDILDNTMNGMETVVKMGEKIGTVK